ncbi:hypothetical protein TcWFU_002542 [Taenia crassiceps]|uniref:Uncharacterized protein n=1 Tax=Taenia crassiceps TaxID=6207 RepID=A0ABR4Q7I0_9CEST
MKTASGDAKAQKLPLMRRVRVGILKGAKFDRALLVEALEAAFLWARSPQMLWLGTRGRIPTRVDRFMLPSGDCRLVVDKFTPTLIGRLPTTLALGRDLGYTLVSSTAEEADLDDKEGERERERKKGGLLSLRCNLQERTKSQVIFKPSANVSRTSMQFSLPTPGPFPPSSTPHNFHFPLTASLQALSVLTRLPTCETML